MKSLTKPNWLTKNKIIIVAIVGLAILIIAVGASLVFSKKSDFIVKLESSKVTDSATTIKLSMEALNEKPFPSEIIFYIANKQTQTLYRAKINNLENGQTISLICTSVCASQNSQYRVLTTVQNLETLSSSEYEGINIGTYNFFFKKDSTIQYIGPLINSSSDDQNFRVLQ